MFFLKQLKRTITVHPSFLSAGMQERIFEKLLADVEGTNTGSYFIICVMDQYDISEGRVIPGSGMIEYMVNFRAVVWKPFKGETLDGIVQQVVANGVFVEVGPLTCFVSRQSIPSDLKFDGNATPPQYTDNAGQVIEKGTQIRVKLVGVRSDIGQMFAVATIKEDYLGPLDGNRSLRDDSKSTTDDSKSTTDDSKSTTDDSKSTVDDSQSTIDDSQSTIDDSQSTTSSHTIC
ncbi:MAG: DNA-directed RNA polymerase II subunit [Bogoriella megaspora]|nr:MAG: DNA-directed RNA polymerase II subunit [Bogoriella megaspora]